MGVSRKSFIGWALDLPEDERLIGTIAALTSFINFNSEPTLEPIDNKHLIGTLDFQFGIGTN